MHLDRPTGSTWLAQPGKVQAWRVVRWLVILFLVLDQLSSPFHGHHHGGLGEVHGHAQTMEHAEDEVHTEPKHGEHASHSLLTLRAEQRQLNERLPIVDVSAVTAFVSIYLAFDDGAERPALQWRLDLDGRDFRSHRSLPPAGRAPPPLA